jgi:hypothetical protein
MSKEQFTYINDYGTKFYYSDREMKIKHREDGPAVENVNGDKWWYVNGELHREDGPAQEYANGSKFWFLNGKLHREDGPASEYGEDKEWWVGGKLHREDGPAIEWADGDKAWYIDDIELTKDEFNARIKAKK